MKRNPRWSNACIQPPIQLAYFPGLLQAYFTHTGPVCGQLTLWHAHMNPIWDHCELASIGPIPILPTLAKRVVFLGAAKALDESYAGLLWVCTHWVNTYFTSTWPNAGFSLGKCTLFFQDSLNVEKYAASTQTSQYY